MLFLKTVRDWSESAKSGLLSARQLNDRTEATLPDAETDHWSQPGPKLPIVLLPVNVGYGETGLLADLEPVSKIQFSTWLFSGRLPIVWRGGRRKTPRRSAIRLRVGFMRLPT
jgi:hypothetical protein